MLQRNQADEGPGPRRTGEAAGIAQFGGDRQGGQIINAAETA
jgi:hypothetical protein